MISRKAEVLVMAILLAASSAFAATYYVDRSAGSDAYNGTAQAFSSGSTGPWQHIPGSVGVTGSGWVKMNAGDSIIVKGGTVLPDSITVNAAWYNNGSSGNTIKILSGHLSGWGSGRAVIDGGATTSGSGTYGKGFWVNGPSYIRIEGFEIRNIANMADSGGVFIDGNNTAYIEIVGNLIHEIYGASGSSGYGIEVTGDNKNGYVLIEKNIIYHTEEKGIELYNQGYCTVRYNWVYQTNDHCVTVSSANNSIYGNMFSQSGYRWMTYESPFRPAYGFKFDGSASILADNNSLYNNLIWDCSSGIGILNGSGNKIYFNTVYHSGFQGGESGGEEGSAFVIQNDGTAGSNIPVGNIARDNIFYFSNLNNAHAPTIAFNYNIGGNNTISRNVVYRDSANTGTLFFYRGSGGNTWNALSWFEGSSGFASISGNVASGNIVVEPSHAGGTGTALMSGLPTGFNANWRPNTTAFALSASTPAQVLAGDVMAAPFNYDIAGALRTQFSLGAYEGTGTVVPPVTPPAPPTGFHAN
jgi:hypothetical protein